MSIPNIGNPPLAVAVAGLSDPLETGWRYLRFTTVEPPVSSFVEAIKLYGSVAGSTGGTSGKYYWG